MSKVKVDYYKLPLFDIPFDEIPSLEKVKYGYVYCSSFPLTEFMNLNFYLISVYNLFDHSAEERCDIDEKDLLFGRVVSDKLPIRGRYRCIKVAETEKGIEKEDLPHLKYSSNADYMNANWFYMKDGDYVILSGIKSDFAKVKHLEGISIYGDNILRLRVVIEMLKRNVKKGLVELSEEDFKNIAFKVLKADPSLAKSHDAIIWDGVNNWVPNMLLTPIYEDIPDKLKERADI